MNIRLRAALVLTPLLTHRGSLKAQLPEALSQCPVEDRALLQQLCYGTLRDFFQLDAIANQMLAKPFRDQDRDLHALLLVGLYQLRSLRIPPHAAVSETVDASGELGKEWARKLINAILRRYQRERQAIEQALANNELFAWNHPQWMIDKLRHNWPEHWQAILQQNNAQAPMVLRVNKRLHTRDEGLDLLRQAGIPGRPGAYADTAIYLEQAVDIQQIPGFKAGCFSVQDEAAQLAAELLDCPAGARVLDACAAPGGKLSHLLEANPGLGEVIAVEMEPQRAERIRDNLERLKLAGECVLHLEDASASHWWDGQPFDRILVDAPCSGSGVIRRNPDIKLLRRAPDLLGLVDLQLSILGNLWQMLKPGGKLLYATCSVFGQENERVIERFTKLHTGVEVVPIDTAWGIARPFGRQLFPQPEGHDGFFYSLLQKQPSA